MFEPYTEKNPKNSAKNLSFCALAMILPAYKNKQHESMLFSPNAGYNFSRVSKRIIKLVRSGIISVIFCCLFDL